VKTRLLAIILLLPLAAFPQKKPSRQADVKVQKTSLSRDQEIQLGKEAAAEVERQMEVVRHPEAEAWLNQIGQQLAKTPQANAYPYYFKLVNEDSINAFALPGGPMFVHTGLIKAADSEGEVAGVLAHEMSHVALRHGAAQLSKQQTYGTLFGALGALGGMLGGGSGQCGVWCQAVQVGAGLGGNSVLMKFSRGYEHDADLNGARMMAAAGYDPIQMAKFFEKLEAKLGTAAEPRGLALWMSSHPATGSRVEYVSQDIQFYPKGSYASSTGNFSRVRQAVASLPPPKPKPGALLQAQQGVPRAGLPQGFKDYQARGFSIAYPGNWQAGQAQAGGSVYLVPEGGVKQGQGGVELLLGAMIDYYQSPNAGASLDSATAEFIQSLQKGDASLRAERPGSVQLGRKPALLTKLNTRTSSPQEPDQAIYLYTVRREAGLWYLVLAAPPSRLGEADPIFRQMAETVQFPD
jgi:Zn-dependent protease with chaperone function